MRFMPGTVRSALDSGGSTIAVLGTGIDVVYPRSGTRLYKRLLANLDRRPVVDSMARTLSVERIGKIFAAVTRAEDALDRNVSPKVVADWLAVQL